jgi:O-glycosyl hydrolase
MQVVIFRERFAEHRKSMLIFWIYLFISCLIVVLFPSSANSQTRQISIDPSITYQRIDNFTASDAWSGNFVGQYWDTATKEQIAKWLFSQHFDASGNPEGIGLSMWRVNLGAGTLEQDSADIMPYQRRAESFLSKDGLSYDWGKCIGHQYFMQKAVESGCNKFLLFSNSPLVQYTKNGKGWSSSDHEANIRVDCYRKFAGYLGDIVQYFTKEKAWNIAYISPVNEPQVKWNSPKQEGSPWKSSEMKKIYSELDKALSERELHNTKILVGESGELRYLYDTSKELEERFPDGDAPDRQISRFFDPNSPDYLGNLKSVAKIIAGHDYGSHKTNNALIETREKVKAETEKYGISFHQSEWCMLPGLKQPMDGFTPEWVPGNYSGIQPALLLGRLVYGDLVHAGTKAWGYWKGMEVNGNHALISLFPPDGDLLKGGVASSNKMLWALGNYSFFIRPGYSRIELLGADDPETLIASAFMSPDQSRIVIVYVNSSFDTISVSLSFLKEFDKKIKKVLAYRTDQRSDLTNMHVSQVFSPKEGFVVPPRSLITMVFDL